MVTIERLEGISRSTRAPQVHLSENQFELVQANIINRELTQQAQQLLQQRQVEHHQFSKLLNAHQNELRDRLQISTPKIDRMFEFRILD